MQNRRFTRQRMKADQDPMTARRFVKTEELPAPLPSQVDASQAIRRRVMLLEGHPIACKGLATLVNQQDDLTVCGVAEDGDSALQKLETLKPDVLVLGTFASAHQELELLQAVKLRFSQTRVLILSAHEEARFARTAIRRGAAGYVMKREPTATVLAAIRQVLEGKLYVTDRLKPGLRLAGARDSGSAQNPAGALSPRELEIFRLMGQGTSTREIAQRLGISVKTVDTHRTHIKEKLDLVTFADVVRAAVNAHREGGL